MKFIKNVFGVPSLLALATVTAFGIGRSPNSSVTITSPSTLPSGVVSTFYSTTLAATGGASPYTWAVKACSGACNTSLGFTSSGILSGMPANAGTSAFTFAATDAKGQTASAVLNITIAGASAPTNTALSITSPSTLPSGVVSTFYSTALAATGGTSPYTWAVKACSGACNTSLGFTSSGILSGMPANAGTSAFTFAVTDAKGQTASAVLNITIAGASAPTNTALSITSPSTLSSGVVSTSYSTSLAATGGTTPYTWAIKSCSGVCNAGLSLSPAGIFSGTPANSGTSTYTVGVTDAAGQTASASLNLTIAAAPASGGANYYVSPTGSDSNPCSQSSPCATPDHAFNLASAGQTVQVAPGTYDYGSGAAQFTKSGTAGNYITVTCATRGACKIQNSVTGNSTVVIISGSYMTFDGFEVTNTSSAGNNLGVYVTTPFVNITRNTIHHIETDCGDMGGGGIVVAGSGSSSYGLSNITIDSNLVYDISMANGVPRCNSSVVQTDGILDENNGNYNVVTNNIVYWVSGGWGISSGNGCCTGGTVVGNQVSNNLVFSTARGGILAGESAGVFLTNNIIVDAGLNFGACGYMLGWSSPVNFANNDLFNNGGGNYCANWGSSDSSIHAGDIAVDPASGSTFANWQANGSGDYHQKAGSPTIGTGSTAGTPPNHDFDGNPRPASGIDMGPYQH